MPTKLNNQYIKTSTCAVVLTLVLLCVCVCVCVCAIQVCHACSTSIDRLSAHKLKHCCTAVHAHCTTRPRHKQLCPVACVVLLQRFLLPMLTALLGQDINNVVLTVLCCMRCFTATFSAAHPQHFTTKYWRWPDAVHLVPQKDDPSMGLQVWNPMDDRDRYNVALNM